MLTVRREIASVSETTQKYKTISQKKSLVGKKWKMVAFVGRRVFEKTKSDAVTQVLWSIIDLL